MATFRKTAVVQLELPSSATLESLPLTRERAFGVYLRLDGQSCPALPFRSPVNDETWREFTRQLREANGRRDRDAGYHSAEFIRSLGRELWSALAATSPRLRAFLGEHGAARRLVIETTRPELHVLPWGALYDGDGHFLAAGDLSIVQCWQHFSETSQPALRTLNLVSVLGADTRKSTASALRGLPPEITRDPAGPVDILHMEEHGNAVLSSMGTEASTTLGRRYASASMALLWSCYSAAANSWGESPALCLHRAGAGLVLSFQAELHVVDARSVAESFYADVFGPAASRDPESALVRIRAAKFDSEYEFANWASMVVFLRAPFDLTALPLNGPRVPAASWASASPEILAAWAPVSRTMRALTSGRIRTLSMPGDMAQGKLPLEVFAGWRGNVIHLRGQGEPIADAVLSELKLARPPRHLDTAARLQWFFAKIERYGSPLIVWHNAGPQHADFLWLLRPAGSLAFLLLYGDAAASMPPNELEAARALAASTSGTSTDADWAAAYYAFARAELLTEAEHALDQLASEAERALLRANYISRFGKLPGPDAPCLSSLDQRNVREDQLREAMVLASREADALTGARARHQLGYLWHTEGQNAAAEQLYRSALEDLQREAEHGPLWEISISMLLRDWAELLAPDREQTTLASSLLQRAMLIQTLHDRQSDLAYALCTAARISNTGGDHAKAAEQSIDAANRFERCANWRGWAFAIEALLDTLASAGDTKRMLAVAQLASDKLGSSTLDPLYRDRIQAMLSAQSAQAFWLLGDVQSCRAACAQALSSTQNNSSAAWFAHLERLRVFLGT